MAASDATRGGEPLNLRRHLLAGQVIPAHPLALNARRTLDERHQRALTRYYVASGAGGMAVGVHTTGFPIHDAKIGLYRPVLELAAETADDALANPRIQSTAGPSNHNAGPRATCRCHARAQSSRRIREPCMGVPPMGSIYQLLSTIYLLPLPLPSAQRTGRLSGTIA